MKDKQNRHAISSTLIAWRFILVHLVDYGLNGPSV